MDLNTGYPLVQLSLNDIKKIFEQDFLRQISCFLINGNLGDFMLAKDNLAIIKYIRQHNAAAVIEIHTNGGAQTSKFWTELAKYNVQVFFGIDGLEDTHSMHRRGTQFQTVMNNAKSFIEAGGYAVWKMIQFLHNEHQIQSCKSLSVDLGFKDFELITDSNRISGPVFDKKGNYLYTLGEPTSVIPINLSLEYNKMSYKNKLHYNDSIKKIKCIAKKDKSIYIAANGDVFPCCFLGFYPKTFLPEFMYGIEQIKNLCDNKKINALDNSLKECIEWFDEIQNTWLVDHFDSGRLYICNSSCGADYK